MAIVRQLPELYLRGSLATITMAGLTERQKEEAQALTLSIAFSPEMSSHRVGMIKELKNTISADYKDEKAGEHEYLIAIYRGVVDVLHHHKYTFCCTACNNTNYTTKQGRIKAIDRMQVPCPNCQCVKVAQAGDTNLAPGQLIKITDFQKAYEHHKDTNTPPEMVTTIVPIRGEKKYPNPQAILNDPIQKKKLFGEYVWNYFRQHINENERKTHSKIAHTITGVASIIYGETIAATLELHKVQHTVTVTNDNHKPTSIISVRNLELLPEISIELKGIIQEAQSKNATVTINNSEIVLAGGDTATTEKFKKERVAVLESTTRVESDVDTIDSVGHRTVGGARMSQEDHEGTVDTSDALEKVRSVLPDGTAQQILSIITAQGDIYKDFSDSYGDGQPKMNHIAEFLGVPTKTVSNTMEKIRVLCIAAGLTP